MERCGIVSCSFCSKPQNEVERIVAGPSGGVYICNECTDLCQEIIKEEREKDRQQGLAGQNPPPAPKGESSDPLGNMTIALFLQKAGLTVASNITVFLQKHSQFERIIRFNGATLESLRKKLDEMETDYREEKSRIEVSVNELQSREKSLNDNWNEEKEKIESTIRMLTDDPLAEVEK